MTAESDACLRALRQWECHNAVTIVQTSDVPFAVTPTLLQACEPPRGAKPPWVTDPHYFHDVRISAVALLRLMVHARSGKGKKGIITQDAETWVEVMGLCQGYALDRTFVITDTFALPVEASEVECAMTDASVLYQVDFLSHAASVGRLERCCGWYHSHPGYSCFLSGVDVRTQLGNQAALGAWVALVVDPVRSLTTGKVEVKAFRTYPEGYTPPTPGDGGEGSAAIPAARLEEAGAFANRYYELPMSIFRSERDDVVLRSLWRSYWAPTFGVVDTRAYTSSLLRDVSSKIRRTQKDGGGGMGTRRPSAGFDDDEGGPASQQPPPPLPANVCTAWGVSVLAADAMRTILHDQLKRRVFTPSTTHGTR